MAQGQTALYVRKLRNYSRRRQFPAALPLLSASNSYVSGGHRRFRDERHAQYWLCYILGEQRLSDISSLITLPYSGAYYPFGRQAVGRADSTLCPLSLLHAARNTLFIPYTIMIYRQPYLDT